MHMEVKTRVDASLCTRGKDVEAAGRNVTEVKYTVVCSCKSSQMDMDAAKQDQMSSKPQVYWYVGKGNREAVTKLIYPWSQCALKTHKKETTEKNLLSALPVA